jgi:hypothetical protein
MKKRKLLEKIELLEERIKSLELQLSWKHWQGVPISPTVTPHDIVDPIDITPIDTSPGFSWCNTVRPQAFG